MSTTKVLRHPTVESYFEQKYDKLYQQTCGIIAKNRQSIDVYNYKQGVNSLREDTQKDILARHSSALINSYIGFKYFRTPQQIQT